MLTLSMSAAILDAAMPRRAPLPLAALGPPMRAVRSASPKERRVEDEQDARYAERRAALQRQVTELPAPGTPAYWPALADPALPMEVLVRCLRERLKAGDRQAAERIFERVLFRTQTSNQLWAAKVTQIAGRQQAAALAKELLQELNWALWQELESERQFIEEGFRAVLERLRQHVSHPYMQQEGLWTRKGVTKPERVPRPLMESLTPPDQDDGDATPTTVVQPADPKAEAAFDRVELAEELQELLAELTPEQRQLLFLYYVEDWTQVEIADHFGVTDRAIRDRLTKVLALLRTLAQQRGGPHD